MLGLPVTEAVALREGLAEALVLELRLVVVERVALTLVLALAQREPLGVPLPL